MKTKKILIIVSVAFIAVLFLVAVAIEVSKSPLTNKVTSEDNASGPNSPDERVDGNADQVAPAQPAPQGPPPKEIEAQVKKVRDGDTVELINGQLVRYIGLDAPELNSSCIGNQPRDRNRELVEGKTVKLVRDSSEIDKYGRMLRYVYTEDGTFVNDVLLKEGLASLMLIAPDKEFADQFENSVREAESEKRGLWSEDCAKKAEEMDPEATPGEDSEDAETEEETVEQIEGTPEVR